ncbi:Predicted arabinose efflux permease, MFS family [Enhydrobacter aerosaccus]|uniref:Predicted arabinose efflux permease, MFS family n=1 Tax=Enhydrobacter aerosaccus TaxID=225324 RepID=A0A1T4PFQ4_9HYPH|nr:MFS transporter [Enhydrobacter aerosaccus]SJZ90201.1 Predicted arabinose efflux permease, MFS family [Enhydrobacter aerosaccus]
MACITTTLDTDAKCTEAPAGSETLLHDSLPLPGLLALAMAAFITVLTEALPAGLLPQMSSALGRSEALIGQLVTAYAIGSLSTAIPLTVATQGWRRRPLLLVAIGGFAIVNTITSLSTDYALTLGARFVAGVFAGLLWALVAGYAARMVAEPLKGRAIAVTMVGIPIALSLGIPAGTLLGAIAGWRVTFGLMTLLTIVLIGWILAAVPDFPGQAADKRLPMPKVFLMPGIRSVLAVTLTFVLAHNILYTYIAPFIALAGIGDHLDFALLIFGLSSLASIWVTGLLIDRLLRELVLGSIGLFALAALALGMWGDLAAITYAGIGLWGLAYGGAATLFQTASAKTAGDAADVAQSMIVTVWNLAIAGGGMCGGLMLETFGAASFPWALILLLLPSLAIAWRARNHGFPPTSRRSAG